MRRHGYLKRFNEYGQLALLGWRFFAQIAMATKAAVEPLLFEIQKSFRDAV